jgi:hypothetical protein
MPVLVQADNRKAVSWEAYLSGARLAAGMSLGDVGGPVAGE